MVEWLGARGWARFPADPCVARWAAAAREAGLTVLSDPAQRAKWLECEGTWFVGVDALPTAPDGRIGDVPLEGQVIRALGPLPPLHRAQLSVVWPGYPRPRTGESDAAFGYRTKRDAAHVDGLLAEGTDRRRRIREPHAFILGLPLTATDPQASPLVVWEGSHHILRDAFRRALAPHSPDTWDEVDVTHAYHAARREIFECCKRVELSAGPGEATVLHRLSLHGVAPWGQGATAPPEGRMIAYFRPRVIGGIAAWLAED